MPKPEILSIACADGCAYAKDLGMPEHACQGTCQRMPETLPSFDTKEAATEWMYEEVDDPCTDNDRFAFEDDDLANIKYAEAESTGCCGSFDRDILVAGKRARIGCNYGH